MSEENERPRRSGTAGPTGNENGRGDARRTERLSPGGDEWNQREPVNPGWRSERTTGTRGVRRGRGGLPASPQEFQLWLQDGGWRYIAGIAVLLIVLLIALLAYGRNDQRNVGLGIDEQKAPTSAVGGRNALTPISSSAIITPTATPAPRFFIVTGTDVQGLFLRPNPSTSEQSIATLPDGTRVEQISVDSTADGRTWRKVRTTQIPTQEGWVAAEFLTPVP
ncbi:MAG: SH3 domain-containing protein [Chloroflexales bacterium]